VSERDRDGRGRDRSERDREKRSWREIDQSRDRGRSGVEPRGGNEPRLSDIRSERESKKYRAALDALFEKGGLAKAAETLLGKDAEPQKPDKVEPAREVVAPAAAAAAPAPAPAKEKEDSRAVLRKKVLDAVGKDEISRAVDKYVKHYGLPQDFEVLEQALDHQKAERVAEAMALLETMTAREKPKRSRTLIGKLRLIEETSDDSDLRAKATLIRQRLG
jgi:type I site-specific restriction-modification system R (restriction) subunit